MGGIGLEPTTSAMSKQCSNQLSYPPEQANIITNAGGIGNPCGIIAPVTKPKRPDELSEQELRRLLLEKRRFSRQQRLDRFRRTGRAVTLSPDLPPASSIEELRTGAADPGQGPAPGCPPGERPGGPCVRLAGTVLESARSGEDALR